MTRILYASPAGEWILNPTAENLRHAILEQPWTDWWHSSNNEASLVIVLDQNETGPHQRESRGKVAYRVSTSHPSAWIKQPISGKFFISFWEQTRQYVHYNGKSCKAFVRDHCGGDEFRIPRACLVTPRTALQILTDFLASQTRPEGTPWVRFDELPLPADFYGDEDE
jgi:hypothetical protein